MNFEEQLRQLIAERAYELSLMRKNGCGDDVSDWLKAEQEVMSELNRRSRRLLGDPGPKGDHRAD